jgi:prolyl oligopeptidase
MVRPFFFMMTLLCSVASQAGEEGAPKAPVRPITDTYFGQKVVDPYRYMERSDDPEVMTWMKAQAAHASKTLDQLPTHQAYRDGVMKWMGEVDRVSNLRVAGGRFFYFRSPAKGVHRLLCVRQGLKGAERVLVDPGLLGHDARHVAIDHFEPSPDGSLVAVGLSEGGSEASVLHVIEVASGRDLGDRVPRTTLAAVSWFPDGQSFCYWQSPEVLPGMLPRDTYRHMKVKRHRVGASAQGDRTLVGDDLKDTAFVGEWDFPYGIVHPKEGKLVTFFEHGTSLDHSYAIANLAELNAPRMAWTRFAAPEDQVLTYALHGKDLYVLSHKGAPRYQVLRTSADHPDLKTAQVVVPESRMVLQRLTVAQDGLYIVGLDGGPSKVLRLSWKGSLEEVPLPYSGSVSQMLADPAGPGVYVELAAWTHPTGILHLAPTSRGTYDTHLAPAAAMDTSAYQSEEVLVPGEGGLQVPLSIVMKKSTKKDGSHPLLLSGYGAYGISTTPVLDPRRLAWLDQGGILAYAHVRGGGEYGVAWHTDGMRLNKPHSVDDFLVCADYLIAHRYTSPGLIGAVGTSAGGILAGGALTRRPDLFGAVIINVGICNPLRFETTPAGPSNTPEFGSVQTEEGFKGLLAMDPYHHVSDGVRYPAVLITAGMNDPRVPAWMPAKLAARLQAATASSDPILLRIDFDAGHGLGSTNLQYSEMLTDWFAFLHEHLRAR